MRIVGVANQIRCPLHVVRHLLHRLHLRHAIDHLGWIVLYLLTIWEHHDRALLLLLLLLLEQLLLLLLLLVDTVRTNKYRGKCVGVEAETANVKPFCAAFTIAILVWWKMEHRYVEPYH